VFGGLLYPLATFTMVFLDQTQLQFLRAQKRLLHNITKTGILHRLPREPADYITVPCMDIGRYILVVAKSWAWGKHTLNPKVNLDMNGDIGFKIFGNPHAHAWFSNTIEASLLGKPHLTLIFPHSQ